MWNREDRLKGARAILYLAQGCFDECYSDTECWEVARDNVALLHRHGVFSSFIELLAIEIDNTEAANNAAKKMAVSLADSVELRTILTVLYIMVEVIRTHEDAELRETFVTELNSAAPEELLSLRLLNMVTKYCSGQAPHFPMKKVLLVLWKVVLVSLGGSKQLTQLKEQYRYYPLFNLCLYVYQQFCQAECGAARPARGHRDGEPHHAGREPARQRRGAAGQQRRGAAEEPARPGQDGEAKQPGRDGARPRG